MSALNAVPSPAEVAARMGRDFHPGRSRRDVARSVRAMGIGMTDARKRGGKKK